MENYKQTLPSEILSGILTAFSYKPFAAKLKTKVIKDGFEKIKPPFLLLVNHMSGDDYKLARAVMAPYRLNFVVDNDTFSKNAFFMKMMGTIPRKVFAVDVQAVRRMVQVVKMGGVLALFPEGKSSADGTPSYISRNIVKLIKMLRIPVVTMNISGTYLNRPLKSKSSYGGKAQVRLSNLLSVNDIDYMENEAIYKAVVDALRYDEFAYQRAEKIERRNATASLASVLYQCPICKKEFSIGVVKNKLKCKSCGAEWSLGRYGVILSDEDKTYDSVPKWYAFQREFTSEQLKQGEYELKGSCRLKILRKTESGFIDAGVGRFEHDGESFVYIGSMEGRNVRLSFANSDRATLMCVYGESAEFSTSDLTYRFYPDNKAAVAKINLVIEEKYKL